MNKTRLENFSDGVFAIAVTLLILNIHIPDSKGLSDHNLNMSLYRILPHVVTFCFSFMVVGVFWVAHHRIFSFVQVLNSRLLWLNIFYLMFVAMIPLPAAILSENPFLPTAILFYSTTLLVIAVMHFILLEYIIRHDVVKHEALTQEVHRSAQRNAIVGPVCYIIAAAACFFNVYVSFAFILTALLFYIFFAGKSKVEEKLIDVATEETHGTTTAGTEADSGNKA